MTQNLIYFQKKIIKYKKNNRKHGNDRMLTVRSNSPEPLHCWSSGDFQFTLVTLTGFLFGVYTYIYCTNSTSQLFQFNLIYKIDDVVNKTRTEINLRSDKEITNKRDDCYLVCALLININSLQYNICFISPIKF